MNRKKYNSHIKRRFWLIYFSPFFFFHCCYGQFDSHYYPRKTYSSSSTELISALESRVQQEAKSMGKTNEIVRSINTERAKFIGKLVKKGAFIKDDSLETYVNNVMDRIVQSNSLPSITRRVLIAESPYVNAFCFGQGIYVIAISLLGRISDENQLAFVMAHEIAHDELGHIRQKILEEGEVNLSKRTKEQINKITTGKIKLEDIEEFRSLIYGVTKYSRRKEMTADSMALVLLQGAKYNKREALSVLPILNTAQAPKYDIGLELFLPLHADDYPFQDYWLNERLSIFKGDNPEFLCFRLIR